MPRPPSWKNTEPNINTIHRLHFVLAVRSRLVLGCGRGCRTLERGYLASETERTPQKSPRKWITVPSTSDSISFGWLGVLPYHSRIVKQWGSCGGTLRNQAAWDLNAQWHCLNNTDTGESEQWINGNEIISVSAPHSTRGERMGPSWEREKEKEREREEGKRSSWLWNRPPSLAAYFTCVNAALKRKQISMGYKSGTVRLQTVMTLKAFGYMSKLML